MQAMGMCVHDGGYAQRLVLGGGSVHVCAQGCMCVDMHVHAYNRDVCPGVCMFPEGYMFPCRLAHWCWGPQEDTTLMVSVLCSSPGQAWALLFWEGPSHMSSWGSWQGRTQCPPGMIHLSAEPPREG